MALTYNLSIFFKLISVILKKLAKIYMKSIEFLAMETDETSRILPFQLQFDKPVASQIKIAEWNPEKVLLAMVTEDSKILLHRFNWQRLWTISAGRCITSLCWRPDGKAIEVGLEDGTISLHDVENGKLFRSLKCHTVAVVPLNWEEHGQVIRNIHKLSIPSPFANEQAMLQFPRYAHPLIESICNEQGFANERITLYGRALFKESTKECALSKDLCHLIVMCSGELNQDEVESAERQLAVHGMHGLHCLLLDTSIFWKRKNELHQVAQQASNIEDLIEVICASLSGMWLDSSPQEKFLSFLGGARTSPSVHQFLVNSLGELGIGLDETLINNATETSGILLAQVELFMRVLSSVVQQFSNFFNWLLKCIKLLMQEPSDQLLPYNRFVFQMSFHSPFLIIFNLDASTAISSYQTHEHGFIDYISFQISGDSSSGVANCIGISRGFMHRLSNSTESASLEAILLSVSDGYHCVDLS
ncbi:hypothetical protein CRYUN_Cryun32bG0032800 [Craigia yunnanensis]